MAKRFTLPSPRILPDVPAGFTLGSTDPIVVYSAGVPYNASTLLRTSALSVVQANLTALAVPFSGGDGEGSEYPGLVVRLDHTRAEYKAAIQALEDVHEKLRTSNQSILRADARDRLLVEIESGKRLLAAENVRVGAVRDLLGGALKWLAEQTVQVALKEAAKAAFGALKELFKHVPGTWL